jgi:hypothetical protein
MARSGVELATAYYSLVPSMDGTASAVNSQLGLVSAAGAKAGRTGGAALGAGLIGGLKVAGVIGAAIGIASAASTVAGYFSDSIGLASDLQESANALSVTYGEQAEAIGILGDTAADRLGLSKIAFNDLATRFSSFAGTIAGEGGDVVGVIDDLTTRGSDFASVYNLDVSDALQLFQSGLAGESEPLRKFGLDLSAAAVEAFAMANGIGESGRELTEAEKVQARYGLLMESTEKTAGDFANTQDGLANSTKTANARFEDAQAAIGEALLPAAEKFADWILKDGVPLTEKLVDLFIKFEPAISATADGLIYVLDYLADNTATAVAFFDAVEDGKLTIEEIAQVLFQLPEPLQEAVFGIAQFVVGAMSNVTNFAITGINTLLGFVNSVLDRLRPVASFMNDIFGGNLSVPRLKLLNYLPDMSGQTLGVVKDFYKPKGVSRGGKFALADGGYVTARPGGVAATVGEGRYDEAVIPLSPSVLSKLGAAIGGAGNGMTLHYNNYGSPGMSSTEELFAAGRRLKARMA